MNVDISGKVIVVTGSSRGIGSELIRSFSAEKAKVVINYYNSEVQARELYDEILALNTDCLMIKANVTNPSEVSFLYHETIKAFGRVDVLINNAGICDDNLIQIMSIDQWKKVLDVNLTGAFLCSREFSKIMIKQNYGKIINIASMKGQDGCAGQVNYSASKAGLIGLTKTLAKELGQYNITVNAICPGFIVTDLNRHDESKKDIAKKKSVLRTMSSLQDLLGFIIYTSSDLFSGVSGRVFNLDSRIT
ncbi:MAG: 3-oxoacyl-[acyl-carrier protein] reductase [Herbinix sp.]|jgi:3-oxoacyl-[acyl-carrier protein] reductase|nr:3-oxoacyl-[acyl-carrier protein] reductase [Herbinix sp.]